MRIYYGRTDGRGLPWVWVWDEGLLRLLEPSQHHRCPDPGHGWGEELQGLNTAWTVLRDALPGAWGNAALALAPRFRTEVISKFSGRDWRYSQEEALTWALGVALEYAWPEFALIPFDGEEGSRDPLS